MGECVLARGLSWKYAMMVSTVGERVLGIQVGQIGAIIDWACSEFNFEQVSLHSVGWNASIVALSVGGLYGDKVERIYIREGLDSLKTLIEKHLDYETYPALFCFGLLKEFDVPELISLCEPQKVSGMKSEE